MVSSLSSRSSSPDSAGPGGRTGSSTRNGPYPVRRRCAATSTTPAGPAADEAAVIARAAAACRPRSRPPGEPPPRRCRPTTANRRIATLCVSSADPNMCSTLAEPTDTGAHPQAGRMSHMAIAVAIDGQTAAWLSTKMQNGCPAGSA